MITNLLITIGYTGFSLSKDPEGWLPFVSISVACFGFYGLMTLGFVIVNQHCGHKARGCVMGLNCLFGAVGLLILAQLGGLAFDKLDKSAPFFGMAVLSFIMFIVIFVTRKRLDNPVERVEGKECPVAH